MLLKKILTAATLFILLTSITSSTFAKEDTRTPIVLTEDERNLVLEEMRTFLDTVRSITVSLSKDDMETISKAAKKVGMGASGEVPPALTKKLPQQFKMLAMQVHKGFDQLALDATDMGDKQQALQQLGAIMGNCVACHAIYRLPEQKN
jgi:mono/diheme cytochrome c family protein